MIPRPPSRPIAVVYHPGFRDFVGAELVAAWIIQTLSATHEVFICADSPPDWKRIDARFSTALAQNPPRWLRPSLASRILSACVGSRGQLLQLSLAQRQLRAFDRKHPGVLWFGTYNETWLPAPGVLYIHHPERVRIPTAALDWPAWRRGLFTFTQTMSLRLGISAATPPSRHHKLVNSRWTHEAYAALGGGHATVLYPPVPPFPPGLQWADRADRVIVLGRWAQPKCLEQAIAIVAGARQTGARLTLAFVGFWHCPPAYRRKIEALASQHDWIEWHEHRTREQVIQLAGSSRYGLHAMENEHFGIAVAELASAGCVTLVPSSGGPPEIVGDPRLTYSGSADAAAKLSRIFADERLQRVLHAHMHDRGLRFAPEQFVANLTAFLSSLSLNVRP